MSTPAVTRAEYAARQERAAVYAAKHGRVPHPSVHERAVSRARMLSIYAPSPACAERLLALVAEIESAVVLADCGECGWRETGPSGATHEAARAHLNRCYGRVAMRRAP